MKRQHGILVGGVAVLGMAGAMPLAAQGLDPIARMAATGANEFILSSQVQRETFSFDEERELRLCNRSDVDDTAPAMQGMGAVGGSRDEPPSIALRVEYEGKSQEVQPGQCRTFTAQELTVSAAEPIPAGWDLRGSVESRDAWEGREGRTRTAEAGQVGTYGQRDQQQRDQQQRDQQQRDQQQRWEREQQERRAEAGQQRGTPGTMGQDQDRTLQEARQALREAQQSMRQAERSVNEAERALRQAEQQQGQARRAEAGEGTQQRQQQDQGTRY
jgi:hypothetical protein